ncbi:MAG: DinB family protein [Saprospiraceae bacterium]|nr:DinB family protein [Saprospiraceae bacterium]MBK8082296.1 DinB family protein [Saprospiraceae bacterium]MBK8369968.1 DinB family protein [Saprospiraceae bacterium]MBP6694978.1 DinB family protein [Saprospiraceae bacterium]
MSHLDFLLKHHLQNRKLLKKLLLSVDESQANEIPPFFNNNIIWNCAHVIAVQQSLIYQLCCKTPRADKSIIRQFTIGTKPTEYFETGFIENIGELLLSTSVQMAEDLNNEEFIVGQPFMTAIKVELTQVEEVLAFTNYHEGLHLGVITSLLKCIQK